MIGKLVWEQGLALLSERFGRELSEGLAAAYALRIVPALDDDRFIAAVSYLVTERATGFGYYPSAREILDAAGADGGADAEAGQRAAAGEAISWLWNNPESNGVARYVSERTAEQRFGVLARRALVAVGGGHRVLTTDARGFPFLRNEYVDLWLAYWRAEQSGAIVGQLADGARRRSKLGAAPQPAAELVAGVHARLTDGAARKRA
jgi:hypothetical protein